MSQSDEQPISCTDCGRKATPDQVKNEAWRFLEISKRYRCPTCARELDEANGLTGVPKWRLSRR